MPGQTIGLSMNFGFEGWISRQIPQPSIENKVVNADSEPILFGRPAILNADNTFSDATSTAPTTTNFAGVAVAEVKQENSFPPSNASGRYSANEPCDVIQQGYVLVHVGRGTPTAGGNVYLRVQDSTEFPNSNVGDFEAQSDGTQTILLPNAKWATGIVDANGMAELKLQYPNN